MEVANFIRKQSIQITFAIHGFIDVASDVADDGDSPLYAHGYSGRGLLLMCPSFLIYSITFSLAVIMAGQSVKASAEMLKNAVTANPTAKHTATVGKSTLESMRKAVMHGTENSFYKINYYHTSR